MLKGIVLVCNNDFKIEEFLYNSFRNLVFSRGDGSLYSICDNEEKLKLDEFIKQIKNTGAAFNWEINVSFKNLTKPLKFSGSKLDRNFFVFGLETNNDVPFLYEELMRINNEQSNYIRQILKNRFMNTQMERPDEDVLNELSQVNNQLANVQRELSKKNVELNKLNQLKNHFLGMAAHDLRNPLGHIYNYAELVENDSDNLTDMQLQFIGVIKSQSLFMLNLVEELLDVSSIESGEVVLDLQGVNIVEFIRTNIHMNKHLANKKSIKINFNPSGREIFIKIDQKKIDQVLNNLLTNAIKYSEQNTEINVEVKDIDSLVQICIRDQGLGIPDDEINNIFKPFNTTSNVSTGGEQSTGLGLFISKRIIESHKGKIWVKSEVGKGSEFYFTLLKDLK
ncbi:MAG: hypothetical protein C0598_10420 [Marinilabiliales bacterium]|nr:MAG: hypothetical protein C0598_10420 [Marinilabiliales bacterium]